MFNFSEGIKRAEDDTTKEDAVALEAFEVSFFFIGFGLGSIGWHQGCWLMFAPSILVWGEF